MAGPKPAVLPITPRGSGGEELSSVPRCGRSLAFERELLKRTLADSLLLAENFFRTSVFTPFAVGLAH